MDPDRPPGQHCLRCGEYEVVRIKHDKDDPDHRFCPSNHGYCRNCDDGLCCHAC